MLVQSDGTSVTLLPALPAEWSEGSVSGICARGGHEISMTWSRGEVTNLTIKSRNDGKVTVRVNGKDITVKTKAGTTTSVL